MYRYRGHRPVSIQSICFGDWDFLSNYLFQLNFKSSLWSKLRLAFWLPLHLQLPIQQSILFGMARSQMMVTGWAPKAFSVHSVCEVFLVQVLAITLATSWHKPLKVVSKYSQCYAYHLRPLLNLHLRISTSLIVSWNCFKYFYSAIHQGLLYLTKKTDGSRQRPYDTVEPLAEDLGLTVDTSCDRDDPGCVKDVVDGYDGSANILICWEHDALTDIVDKLGDDDAPDYPDDRYV